MKPSSVSRVINHCISIKRPVFLWGPPGIGKSDVITTSARDNDMELRDVRLNLLDPVDLKGFPVPDADGGVMKWLPPDFLPPTYVRAGDVEGYKLKKGEKADTMIPNPTRGILFLDEMNSALPATQAAGYQLILNRSIGNYVLPEGWAIIAAGNRDGDRGVTSRMPAPLANRLVHIDFDVDVDDWASWALKNGVHQDVIAFMKFKPSLLHSFDPAKNERAFPSPRSWAFASQIISHVDPKAPRLSMQEEHELIKGTVGEGPAGEFMAFRKDAAEMPSIDKILLAPEKVPVPESPSVLYALSIAMAMKASPNNFDRLVEYSNRMQVEFQVVFMRTALQRDSDLQQCKAFHKWAIDNSSVLI